MKKKMVYYGATDLRQLRRLCNKTVEQLAELSACSERTINRVEEKNWTGNPLVAESIAKALGYSVEQLFIPEDQNIIEAIYDYIPFVPCGVPLPGETYYELQVRRTSWFDANLYGKTMWLGAYDAQHELRVLHALTWEGVARLRGAGIPTINRRDEWESFLYHATIGRIHRVMISETCAKENVRRVLGRYAVKPDALLRFGRPDVIRLGDYRGETDIFSVPEIKRRRAYRRRTKAMP